MRKFPVLLLLFLAILTVSAQSVTVDGVFDYEKAKDIVKRMNNIRKADQLPPLAIEPLFSETTQNSWV